MDQTSCPTTFIRISLADAEAQFPSAVDDDIRELDTENAGSPGYHTLGVRDGNLYSMTYEVGWCGWAIWTGTEWSDLSDVDQELYDLLEDAGDTVKHAFI